MLCAPIHVAYSDKAVAKPLPIAVIPNRFQPADIGPREGYPILDPYAPRIEMFRPPVYSSDPNVPADGLANPPGVVRLPSGPSECPVSSLLLRNPYETFNTTNAVQYGGFDPYNVNDIPGCGLRDGYFMNYKDSVNPWNRVMVKQYMEPPIIRSSGRPAVVTE